MSEVLFDRDPNPRYSAGLLGATAPHPVMLTDARLLEIERRVLAIQAAMCLTVRDGQMIHAGGIPLPFDLSEVG